MPKIKMIGYSRIILESVLLSCNFFPDVVVAFRTDEILRQWQSIATLVLVDFSSAILAVAINDRFGWSQAGFRKAHRVQPPISIISKAL